MSSRIVSFSDPSSETYVTAEITGGDVFTRFYRYITSAGAWAGSGTTVYGFTFFANNWEKITITASARQGAFVSFLKSDTTSYVDNCDGTEKRYLISSGTSQTFDIPSDCTYIYIMRRASTSTILLPAQIDLSSSGDIFFYADDTMLKSVSMITNVDLVSNELSIDTLDVVLRSETPIPSAPYGLPIYYFEDEILHGKFYLKNMTRLTATDYSFSCVSAIGILGTRYHNGGVYGGVLAGDTVSTVLASILDDGYGGTIVPYSIDTAVANTPVYGWLPRAQKRDNLHQLMFAYAISIIKNADGSVRFTFLDNQTEKRIENGSIFIGGSVTMDELATGIDVTEHSFTKLSSDPITVLFDNTETGEPADNALVVFADAPVHDLNASGLTVIESGTNYAIVSGVGRLSGQPYTHSQRVRRANVEDAGFGYLTMQENVISVSDCTLITPVNAENCIKRLLAYYSSRRSVQMDIILCDNQCGDQISFENPFGENDAGYITQLDVRASSFLRAKANVICGYTAQGFGNYYSKYAVLTGSGTWTAPDDVKDKIRVIMIGGGTGGNGGNNGTQGSAPTVFPGFGEAGVGGEGGEGGNGGNIFTVDLTGVSPGSSFAYACGSGGTGGAVGGEIGTAGTNTTFGSYSSASGAPIATGFVNLIGGEVFGYRGTDGTNGGAGGSEQDNGESVTVKYDTYPGGRGGAADQSSGSDYASGTYKARGGGGGGAANAKAGGNSYAKSDWSGNTNVARSGAGANATAPEAAAYGCGGGGGNGGGGAGAVGYTSTMIISGGHATTTYRVGSSGAYGRGTAGADGGDGCVVIYYG